ncbi:exocyst complex component EXO70A1-like [Aristolochia californica]|uniref:exocyst complex component EXO70A1-like n=1 Tax=Aristolochia californica TaxID=171875 RepID=UPI0035E30033
MESPSRRIPVVQFPARRSPVTCGEHPRDDIYKQLISEFEAAEKLILRWDSTASEEARERMIFDGDRDEAAQYLQAVDEIQRSISHTSLSDGDSAKATGAIQVAMARLEDEFRNILITHSNPPAIDSLNSRSSSSLSGIRTASCKESDDEDYGEDPRDQVEDGQEQEQDGSCSRYRSTNSISVREIDLIPSDAIYDLRNIAERMITAGCLRECIQVYGSVRKSVVDCSLRQLGVEKLSIGDVQRLEWEALESKIRKWIHAAKICVRILFASEMKLCERIFEDLAPPDLEADDACFMETVKGGAIQVFNFAEAISISRRSPEKLFKILDLHDAVYDLLPDITAVFRSKSSESVRTQAEDILMRLAEAARGILSEFENAVQREPSKTPVPGGTLHPLVRYVMNYVSLISDYKQTLIELIVTKPSGGSRFSEHPIPEMDFPDSEDKSPLALHLVWIIKSLQVNLEGKSMLYKDTALSHLFLMNNVHYIVQKIKGSPELREMIGDDYLRRLTGKYRQCATSYQRATWVRTLSCLRDEGLHVSGGFSSGVSKAALRERFKSFNSSFEEAHRVQSTWFVPDLQLREELRISIAEILLPAYRSFLGRFRCHLENSKNSEMYIKYSVEDLESALLDFFEGSPVSLHIRRMSH